MVANALLACSLLIIVMSFPELILNDDQKKRLESRFLNLWDRVDDLNSRQIALANRIISPLKKWGASLVALIGLLVAVSLLDLVIVPIFYFGAGYEETEVYFLVDIAFFALLIGPLILMWASIAVVRAVSTIFLGVELLVRRIAEQPKSMLAISTLTGAIAGVLKSL